MASIKVLIGEKDGVEFDVPTEFQLNAVDVPFDNSSNGFTASDVQAAIEEAAGSGGLEDYESFFKSVINSTTSNGWVTYIQEETSAKAGGNYLVFFKGEVGQSKKQRRVGFLVEWRENATGSWNELIDIRNGVSVDNQYQIHTGFSEISISASSTIELRFSYGQTDDGGTGRIKNAGYTLWKVG